MPSGLVNPTKGKFVPIKTNITTSVELPLGFAIA